MTEISTYFFAIVSIIETGVMFFLIFKLKKLQSHLEGERLYAKNLSQRIDTYSNLLTDLKIGHDELKDKVVSKKKKSMMYYLYELDRKDPIEDKVEKIHNEHLRLMDYLKLTIKTTASETKIIKTKK